MFKPKVQDQGAVQQELPFVQALHPRMEATDAQLGALLAEGLKASLLQDVPSARRHCLAAFAVGDTASAEQVCVPSGKGQARSGLACLFVGVLCVCTLAYHCYLHLQQVVHMGWSPMQS